MRCARHGLATASDGRCVLCRREAGIAPSLAPAVAPDSAPAWLLPNLLLLALVSVAFAGFWFARSIAGLGLVGVPPAASHEAREPDEATDDQILERLDEARSNELEPALRHVEVEVYFASGEAAGEAARQWLEKHKIEYVGYDIHRDPIAIQRLERLDPEARVPTIVVDGSPLVGFDPHRLSQLLLGAARRRAAGR